MKRITTTVLVYLSLLLYGSFFSCKSQGTSDKETQVTGDKEVSTGKPVKVPEAQGSRRILFVGNSHTEYYVSIPDLFEQLCRFNHNDIEVAKVVEMGISLQDIYRDHKDKVAKACAGTDPDGNYYDYIVLQEKTPVAITNAAEYKVSVKQFMEVIRKNSPGAVLLVYEVMSPADHDKEKNDYNELYKEMKQIAQSVVTANDNAKLYRVSDAVTAAYEGKHGYNHLDAGRDRLRYGDNTLHLLNDGGFVAATLLYSTLFDKAPALPEQMSLSTGTGDNDMPELQPVKAAVSDPEALVKIAMDYK